MAKPAVPRVVTAVVHGRYLVRHSKAPGARSVLVGFHGYAENAELHLEELERIPGVSAWTLVAVQALHPFYNSRSGDVVASWMTRQDRRQAIADNIRYVAEVVRRLAVEEQPAERLVYIGFSQGTAMAYRAAAGAGHRCHGVVALAGDVPGELADRDLTDFPTVLIGRGDSDDWYTADKLSRDLQLLKDQGISCRAVEFEGGHEWTGAFRESVGDFLEGIRVGQGS